MGDTDTGMQDLERATVCNYAVRSPGGPRRLDAHPCFGDLDCTRVPEARLAVALQAMSSSCLVGFTGFVGATFRTQQVFQDLFRSTNIEQIRGRRYEAIVVAGAQREKRKANRHPEDDRRNIDRLVANLREATASRAILISTVDVYPVIRDADESFDCAALPNHAYGANRLLLEQALREKFAELYIARLPALFGPGFEEERHLRSAAR